MSWLSRYAVRFALLGALPVVASACNERPATAIVVAIASEAVIPKELDAIGLTITRGSNVRFSRLYPVDKAAGTARLPGTLTLKPEDGEDPDDPIKVQIVGITRSQQVVLRSATMGFVEEKQKLLRLTLRYSCFDVPFICDAGTTCIGGRCESDKIDTAKLPDFEGGEVFVKQGSPGCFDARDSVCAKDRKDVPDLAAFAAAGCKHDTGRAGDAANLNVFVFWAAQSNKSHPVTLEAQSPEGWTSTAPGSFTLAAGMCDAVKSGRIRKVAYNFACPSKPEALPVCLPPDDAPADKPFLENKCHACVYAPDGCKAEFDDARAAGTSEEKAMLTCALECSFDGVYDTLDECSAVRGCFFGCLSPYLSCDKAGTCASMPRLDAWSICLSKLPSISERCAADCTGTGAEICQKPAGG